MYRTNIPRRRRVDPVKSARQTRVRRQKYKTYAPVVTIVLLTLIWKSKQLYFMINPTDHQNIVSLFLFERLWNDNSNNNKSDIIIILYYCNIAYRANRGDNNIITADLAVRRHPRLLDERRRRQYCTPRRYRRRRY